MSTLEGTLCRTSQEELEHDLATIDFSPEDLAERVRLMVEDDDQLGDALAEPEVMENVRLLWAAIPKGRPGFQPRTIDDIMHQDATLGRLLIDLSLRLGASITDYMEEGQ